MPAADPRHPEYQEGYARGYNDARTEREPIKKARTRKEAAHWMHGYWAGWNRVVDEKQRGWHQ